MLTLLSEAIFWTTKDNIVINSNDFGAYKFSNKKNSSLLSIQNSSKQDYASKRNLILTVDNKRPIRLKNSLKKLEDMLKQYKIIYYKWKDTNIIQFMLINGMIIYICVNIFNGNIIRIAFDDYFIGKLITENVTDVIITRMYIIISYKENHITFLYLQKPNIKKNAAEKISLMEPKIYNIIIGGTQSRQISRNILLNKSFDLLLIWTKSSQNEVYPWRPTLRDQDRANLHIYKLSSNKLELLCYYWTENDPICIKFSKLENNKIHTVEEKISRKGEVTIENCIYEIKKTKLERLSVVSIPLQTQVCSHAFSPDNEKLMLGCIDGSIIIYDESRGITHLAKAAFIPTLISWHSDSALVMIANERCQLQCFDISLSCVKNQLLSEDITSSNVLDLANYFQYQPILNKIFWNKKSDITVYNEHYLQTDSFLILLLDNGPIICLRFIGGNGLKGDIYTSGFTADVLIQKYLALNLIEKSINILLCLNWDTYGAMCLASLHNISNSILKLPLTFNRELLFEKALGSFLIPVRKLCVETDVEFREQVNDITRKFFHYLLRYKSYQKALSLAIDINEDDLFMDLYNAAKNDNLMDLAKEAHEKAEQIINNKSETCSITSCSECSDDTSSNITNEIIIDDKQLDEKLNQQQLKHPPLPKLTLNNFIAPYLNDKVDTVDDLLNFTIQKPDIKIIKATKINKDSNKVYNNHMYTNYPIMNNYNNNINDDDYFTNIINNADITDYYDDKEFLYATQAQKQSQNNNNNKLTVKKTNTIDNSNDINYNPNRNIQILDQTLGIPLINANTNSHYSHKQTLIKSKFPLLQVNNLIQNDDNQYYNSPPVQIHEYPLISGNIPSSTINSLISPPSYWGQQQPQSTQTIFNKVLSNYDIDENYKDYQQISTNSILTNNSTQLNNMSSSTSSILSKKDYAEKNKVKFSDTVTVAVVPEIPRKEKINIFNGDRLKIKTNPMLTDPRRELADSLPLCHPNDEYLKDFMPMSEMQKEETTSNNGNGNNNSKTSNSIKVIHFGVV